MLPKKYNYLNVPDMPRMIKEGLKTYGVIETPGKANNPIIMAWAKEVGQNVAKVYLSDAIPWCALWCAVVAKRAGKEIPAEPLWALNWGTFGRHVDCPALGDVLVFVRRTADGKRAGHVALYAGETKTTYVCLGGNQADSVCITEIAKERLYTARRPLYTVQPGSVTQVWLNASGVVSNNEA